VKRFAVRTLWRSLDPFQRFILKMMAVGFLLSLLFAALSLCSYSHWRSEPADRPCLPAPRAQARDGR